MNKTLMSIIFFFSVSTLSFSSPNINDSTLSSDNITVTLDKHPECRKAIDLGQKVANNFSNSYGYTLYPNNYKKTLPNLVGICLSAINDPRSNVEEQISFAAKKILEMHRNYTPPSELVFVSANLAQAITVAEYIVKGSDFVPPEMAQPGSSVKRYYDYLQTLVNDK
jgi:hypothetical protein